MKCKYCGGNIGLEDRVCPHCGRINELAQQHIQDMRQYSEEFAETKEGVYQTTRRYTGVAVRAVVLAALLAAVFVMWFLTENAYSLARDAKERDAEKNAAVYIQKMEDMLAVGDYRGLANFAEAHYIHDWLEEYEAYAQIIGASQMYTRAVQYLMSSQIDGLDELTLNEVGYFATTLPDFYRQTDPERFGSGVDREKTDRAIAGMQENLNALMKTYLGLTDEEIKEQETMTDARRTVFFQDKYEALHSGRDHEDAAAGEDESGEQ
ncbi:MAG: hypothetical protein Q4C58_01665 [Eubacteriales bacterium]|nr:hypothetical protein [Eubacteriales bacterium]